jgi:DNA-binding MarR family transcriptional regulator
MNVVTATVERPQAEAAESVASLLPALMGILSTFDEDPAAHLPLAQLRVCVILGGGPRSMSALGRELGVSLSAMTRIADRLERARLVERVAVGDDRRIRRLRLTPRGETIMRRRHEARVRNVSAVLAGLSPQEATEVQNALEALMDACKTIKRREDTSDA